MLHAKKRVKKNSIPISSNSSSKMLNLQRQLFRMTIANKLNWSVLLRHVLWAASVKMQLIIILLNCCFFTSGFKSVSCSLKTLQTAGLEAYRANRDGGHVLSAMNNTHFSQWYKHLKYAQLSSFGIQCFGFKRLKLTQNQKMSEWSGPLILRINVCWTYS